MGNGCSILRYEAIRAERKRLIARSRPNLSARTSSPHPLLYGPGERARSKPQLLVPQARHKSALGSSSDPWQREHRAPFNEGSSRAHLSHTIRIASVDSPHKRQYGGKRSDNTLLAVFFSQPPSQQCRHSQELVRVSPFIVVKGHNLKKSSINHASAGQVNNTCPRITYNVA